MNEQTYDVIDGETGEVFPYDKGVDACAAARRESAVSDVSWLVISPPCSFTYGEPRRVEIYREGVYNGRTFVR